MRSRSSRSAGGLVSSGVRKIPSSRALRPNATLLRKIETGIEKTRPASTKASHAKYAGMRIIDETPQTTPKTVWNPWVMIASRQSVPSTSAALFCATQLTPWPSSVKMTNLVLKIMLIGARSMEIAASRTALATSLPRPP